MMNNTTTWQQIILTQGSCGHATTWSDIVIFLLILVAMVSLFYWFQQKTDKRKMLRGLE